MSPPDSSAATVRIGKSETFVRKSENVVPDPKCVPAAWPHTVRHIQSRWVFKFWEMWLGGGGEVVLELQWRTEEWGGRRGGGSVGGVRVNASGSFCGWSHWWGGRSILPATVRLREEEEKGNRRKGRGSPLLSHSLLRAAGSNTVRYDEWKVPRAKVVHERSVESATQSHNSLKPRFLLDRRGNEANVAQTIISE